MGLFCGDLYELKENSIEDKNLKNKKINSSKLYKS